MATEVVDVCKHGEGWRRLGGGGAAIKVVAGRVYAVVAAASAARVVDAVANAAKVVVGGVISPCVVGLR